MASLIKLYLDQAIKELQDANAARIKAGRYAVKAEAYRLMRLLQAEIKAGAPGGRKFADLGIIGAYRLQMQRASYAKRYRKQQKRVLARMEKGQLKNTGHIQLIGIRRLKKNMDMASKGKPLFNLYKAVRYSSSTASDSNTMSIGATGAVPQGWIDIFRKQQTGGVIDLHPATRRKFIQFGAMAKRYGDGIAQYFFLRKATQELNLPARDIIDSFWKAHQAEVGPNIQKNFENRLSGWQQKTGDVNKEPGT